MGGAVPISPSLISGAVPFTFNGAAVPTNIKDNPVEGAKFVPIQIGFSDAPVKLVDFSNITPTQQFSKISSLYIDASASTHDINILFPDNGYQTRISFGDTAMIPVLTSKATPKFYVILDDGNTVNATDVVNIFALNFFVPPLITKVFDRAVSYGYGQFQQLVPVLAQSTQFCLQASGLVNGLPVTIIPHQQWYITSLNINFGAFSTSNAQGFTIALYDNNNMIFAYNGATNITGGIGNYGTLTDTAGLNYVSSGGGALTAKAINMGSIGSLAGNFNVGGGVLVS